MLPDQFQKLEEVLEAGCTAQLATGNHVIYGRFADEEGGFCPIWSSIDRKSVAELPVESDINRAHFGLVQALGFKISEMDMLGFINAFDALPNSGGDKMVYALGKKFREKYIKEEEEVEELNVEEVEVDESDVRESETGDEG